MMNFNPKAIIMDFRVVIKYFRERKKTSSQENVIKFSTETQEVVKVSRKRPNFGNNKSYHAFRSRDTSTPIKAKKGQNDLDNNISLGVFDRIIEETVGNEEVFQIIFPDSADDLIKTDLADETIICFGKSKQDNLGLFFGRDITSEHPIHGLISYFCLTILKVLQNHALNNDCELAATCLSCSVLIYNPKGLPSCLRLGENGVDSTSICHDVGIESLFDMAAVIASMLVVDLDRKSICIKFHLKSEHKMRTVQFILIAPRNVEGVVASGEIFQSSKNFADNQSTIIDYLSGKRNLQSSSSDDVLRVVNDGPPCDTLRDLLLKGFCPGQRGCVLALIPSLDATTCRSLQLARDIKTLIITSSDVTALEESNCDEVEVEGADCAPASEVDTSGATESLISTSGEDNNDILQLQNPNADAKEFLLFGNLNKKFSGLSPPVSSKDRAESPFSPMQPSEPVSSAYSSDLMPIPILEIKRNLTSNLSQIIKTEEYLTRYRESESKLQMMLQEKMQLEERLRRAEKELRMVGEVWKQSDVDLATNESTKSMSSYGSDVGHRSNADDRSNRSSHKRGIDRHGTIENETEITCINTMDDLDNTMGSPRIRIGDSGQPQIISSTYNVDSTESASPQQMIITSTFRDVPAVHEEENDDEDEDNAFDIPQQLHSFFDPLMARRRSRNNDSSSTVQSMNSSSVLDKELLVLDDNVAGHIAEMKLLYEKMNACVDEKLTLMHRTEQELQEINHLRSMLQQESTVRREAQEALQDMTGTVARILEENKRLKEDKERAEKMLAVLASGDKPSITVKGLAVPLSSSNTDAAPSYHGESNRDIMVDALFQTNADGDVQYAYLSDEDEASYRPKMEELEGDRMVKNSSNDDVEFIDSSMDLLERISSADLLPSQGTLRRNSFLNSHPISPSSNVSTTSSSLSSLPPLNPRVQSSGLANAPGNNNPTQPQQPGGVGDIGNAILATMQYTVSWIPGF